MCTCLTCGTHTGGDYQTSLCRPKDKRHGRSRMCRPAPPRPLHGLGSTGAQEPARRRQDAHHAVRNGTGKIELRTRAESNETELVLVSTDGSEPLWLARTPAYFR